MEEDKKEEIEIVKVTEELIKVKNNSERFASDFAFKLTKEEVNNLRSKNLTSSLESGYGGRRYNLYRFSECFLFCLHEKNPKNFWSKISTKNIKNVKICEKSVKL